jgi:sugar phosphate isomerase/epimerase
VTTYSIAHLTFPDASVPEQVSAAAEAGYDYLDLRVIGLRANGETRPLWEDEPMVRETESRLAATGLRVLDVNVLHVEAGTSVDDALPLFEIAQRFDARDLLVMGWDPDESSLVDKLAALCEAAKPYDVTISLEFARYTAVKSVEAAQRVVTVTAQPNMAIMIDALHLARSGGTPEAVAAVEPARLRYVQFCDARPEAPPDDSLRWEAQNDRLLPGEGALPLFALARALPPDIPISIEVPSLALRDLPAAEIARRCLDATKNVLARARD